MISSSPRFRPILKSMALNEATVWTEAMFGKATNGNSRSRLKQGARPVGVTLAIPPVLGGDCLDRGPGQILCSVVFRRELTEPPGAPVYKLKG